MANIEKTVFISYRRDNSYEALAVYQFLTNQQYDVFLDYTSIHSGDFEQIIVSNIRARAHFLIILTPTALERCSEPGDWLRREIETAIDEKRNIIPLFFNGFSFSSPNVVKNLTGKLAALRRYNGLNIPPGYFNEAMARLSNDFLNVPLDAILLPVPTEFQKVVKDVQQAANDALIERSDDIKELVKQNDGHPVKPANLDTATSYPADRRSRSRTRRSNLRLYGIGAGVLLVLAIGIAGIQTWVNNNIDPARTPTEITQLTTDTTRLGPTSTLLTDTLTTEPSSSSATSVIRPSPVLPSDTGIAEPVTPSATELPTSTSPILGPIAGDIKVSPVDGATLVYVPPGKFTMGLTPEQISFLRTLCNDAGCEEVFQASQPAHQVELTSGYWIYRTEVSNAQYSLCVAAGSCITPRSYSSAGQAGYYENPAFKDYPVVWVDWNRAEAYCSWAGGTLPTSAQWEYAARGDDGRLFPWGNNLPDKNRANVAGLFGKETTVTGFADFASPFGLLNATGNVWEWVSDWYSVTYYSENADWVDPKGPLGGDYKVGRGGSWWIKSALASVAIQDWYDQDSPDSNFNYDAVGFRCVSADL